MLASLYQQVGRHTTSREYVISEYGDPDASPELVYVSPFLSLYTKLQFIIYLFLCTTYPRTLTYCCQLYYSYAGSVARRILLCAALLQFLCLG
jgi:hypothetical protein